MFAVAEILGMTVGEVGERMTAGELIEWVAYMQLKSGNTITKGGAEMLPA